MTFTPVSCFYHDKLYHKHTPRDEERWLAHFFFSKVIHTFGKKNVLTQEPNKTLEQAGFRLRVFIPVDAVFEEFASVLSLLFDIPCCLPVDRYKDTAW